MEKYLNRKWKEKVDSEGWSNEQCNGLMSKRYLSTKKSIWFFWWAVQVLLRSCYTSVCLKLKLLKLLVKKEEKNLTLATKNYTTEQMISSLHVVNILL